MKKSTTVDEFLMNSLFGQDILNLLRAILLSTELIETVKWGIPCYTFNEKNVVSIGSFKSYVGLWFYQGALLKDEKKVLFNAQENVTKALRQWRFKNIDEVDDKLILKYINEAIENQKQNRGIKSDRNKPIVIPVELSNAFRNNKMLETNFKAFTKGKQREFTEYISSAKRKETRQIRLKKVVPLIHQNIGLNDKYRK